MMGAAEKAKDESHANREMTYLIEQWKPSRQFHEYMKQSLFFPAL
jgi:hypothetical protein